MLENKTIIYARVYVHCAWTLTRRENIHLTISDILEQKYITFYESWLKIGLNSFLGVIFDNFPTQNATVNKFPQKN